MRQLNGRLLRRVLAFASCTDLCTDFAAGSGVGSRAGFRAASSGDFRVGSCVWEFGTTVSGGFALTQ